MRKIFVVILVSAIATGCSREQQPVDVTHFQAPDSLGKTIQVSVHDEAPLGEISFISFGNAAGDPIRLVTYFSDGKVLTEKLSYNASGELASDDGEPRFFVNGLTAERMCSHAATADCMDINIVTR